MLVEFSVANYKSFKERVTFSLVGVPNKEHEDHTFAKGKFSLLKTSVIYGANASGKSNLIKALGFMRSFVLNSAKRMQSGNKIPVEPFLLDSETKQQPSEFEVVLFSGEILYRYGFCADQNAVKKEWLYSKKDIARAREICLFFRENDKYKFHPTFKEADKKVINLLRDNALLISLLDQFNGEISTQILKWFSKLHIFVDNEFDPVLTINLIKQGKVPEEWVKEFIIKSDLAISNFQIKDRKLDFNRIPPFLKDMIEQISPDGDVNVYNIATEHIYYDPKEEKYKIENFDMAEQESKGTQKFFSLAGILYLTLTNHDILFIDEIDASLHSELTKIIIKLFQSPETNKGNAQFVFTTHDTCHLDRDKFRRDEIWFTEKDSHYATDLYSLVEYKMPKGSIRKDASYRKDYIKGKYGAIPFVNFSDFTELFKKVK
ncbi:MAG TPA: ATP-binding protein [Candidatus Cloacimonadota bacterium]|nr:ATP-binding protein [Candidatus Cloacimonadota bacterium]HQL14751.1 ATP-binding protein [Candidatus Cloacimonadota bacterium]